MDIPTTMAYGLFRTVQTLVILSRLSLREIEMGVLMKMEMALLILIQPGLTVQFGPLQTELTYSWVIQPNGQTQMVMDTVTNLSLQQKEIHVWLMQVHPSKIDLDVLIQIRMVIRMEI